MVNPRDSVNRAQIRGYLKAHFSKSLPRGPIDVVQTHYIIFSPLFSARASQLWGFVWIGDKVLKCELGMPSILWILYLPAPVAGSLSRDDRRNLLDKLGHSSSDAWNEFLCSYVCYIRMSLGPRIGLLGIAIDSHTLIRVFISVGVMEIRSDN